MKILKAKRKSWKELLALTLIVLLFTVITTTPVLEAAKADCERGYFKCMVTAALLTIGSIGAGASWAVFCSVGYGWCLEFMD